MDQNLPPSNTPPTDAPVAPSTTSPMPQASTIQPVTGSPSGSTPPPTEKKKIPMIVAILVIFLIVLVIGVAAYFMMNSTAPKTTSLPVATPTVAPTATLTPEEEEVDAIDTGASESSDLEDVEKDINSLVSPTP